MKSYRNYLNAIGRRRIDPDKLRTVKEHGSIEIAWDCRDRDWRRIEYEHPLLKD
jgi:hypothetical protein